VLEEAFDEPALCQLLSQEKQQAPPDGMRLQQLDKIYVDVITLRKRNDAARTHVQDPPAAHRSAVHHRRRARAAGRGAAGAHHCDAVHDGTEHRDQSVGRRRVSRRAGADSRRVGAVDGARL
jgi:hypothetical protein